MELYPAIDLYEGKAVRLLHGNYNEMTVYSDDPVAVAEGFRAAGARYLHLVDLEAARDGGTPNIATVKEICAKSGLIVEIGGGVRNMHTAEAYLRMGAARVIIGTAAVTDPDFLREALREFDDRIAIAVDIKGGFVATHGWVQTSEETCFDFCRKLENKGVSIVSCIGNLNTQRERNAGTREEDEPQRCITDCIVAYHTLPHHMPFLCKRNFGCEPAACPVSSTSVMA